ncbi:metaxin-2-like isoform X4 [Branchiostoma lanceolatum]|uniref:metaxin-2-like isoform X4 n=1 Tax=Branchiostoma lanceolatum TaxID=7740 RepID=UPI003453181B
MVDIFFSGKFSGKMMDYFNIETGASEPWPDDVCLYQPYKLQQVLLPDNAQCLAVQCYLQMCGLPFRTVLRTNAEHMSPSGKPPFLRAGPYVISEVEPIIKFVSTKGHSLSEKLDRPQQAEMKAYLALVQGTLGNAELYISWCDPTTASEISRPRYSSPYPWPLNTVLAYRKQWDVQNQLKTLGWYSKTLEEVYDEVDNCCKALAQRLGNHHYFFKQGPTELDALVFGHLYTILTTPLTDNCLADIVKEYGNLINFCRHIEKKFFEERERGPKD